MLQPTLGASSAGNSGSGGSSSGSGTDSASRSSSSDADQPSVKERTGPTSTAAAVTSEPAAKVQATVVATWALLDIFERFMDMYGAFVFKKKEKQWKNHPEPSNPVNVGKSIINHRMILFNKHHMFMVYTCFFCH